MNPLSTFPFKLYRMYARTGWYMRLFFVYRWLVFPFAFIHSLVPKKGTIYDLGCGHGIFASYLAFSAFGRRVRGIDIKRERISFAQKVVSHKESHMDIDFILADVTKIKIPPSDCFTMIDFLHHLPSVKYQELILKRCYHLLKPKGQLIIADIDMNNRLKYWFGVFVESLVYHDMKTTYRPVTHQIAYLKSLGFTVKTQPIDKGYPYASYLYVCIK